MSRTLAAIALLLGGAGPGAAFKIVVERDPITFRQETAAADFVAVLRLERSVDGPNAFSEFTILEVFKVHPALKGKKTLRHRRAIFVPAEHKGPFDILTFVSVEKGGVDLYRGIPARPDLLGYVRGLMAIDAADTAGPVRHALPFLEHKDRAIAVDAVTLLTNLTRDERKTVAARLPLSTLQRQVRNRGVPILARDILAEMLGHTGNAEDAAFLRAEIQQTIDRDEAPRDGFVIGLVLLDPEAGWDTVLMMLSGPRKLGGPRFPGGGLVEERNFLQRYAALKTCRFFVDVEPRTVPPAQRDKALQLALTHVDLADMAIEDLRRWARWDLADSVLPLLDKQSHQIPIIRRAVIRYALCCPGPRAADLIARERQVAPDLVASQEEFLRGEKEVRTTPRK